MSNFADHIWKNEEKKSASKKIKIKRSSAIEIHGHRKRNPPRVLIIAILWCMAFISSVHELNRDHYGYRVKRTERKINYSLCMDE
jgi:hypothetical protein